MVVSSEVQDLGRILVWKMASDLFTLRIENTNKKVRETLTNHVIMESILTT